MIKLYYQLQKSITNIQTIRRMIKSNYITNYEIARKKINFTFVTTICQAGRLGILMTS